MPKVTFVNEKRTIDVPAGANLRREAMKAGIGVYKGVHKVVHCPGFGLCGSCRVLIKKGQENVSQPGLVEKLTTRSGINPEAQFAYIGHEEELRLSCQCTVNGDIEVESMAACNWHGERFWG